MAGVKRQLVTDRYAIWNGDCIEVMEDLPDESIHGSIYSRPHSAGLYHYSSDERDLRPTPRSYAEFFEHYGYVIREKLRLTIPGRTSAVHAAPGAVRQHRLGLPVRDFPGDVIRAHEEAGWLWVARHAIWKEPLGAQPTMQKNLAHKTIVEDGFRWRRIRRRATDLPEARRRSPFVTQTASTASTPAGEQAPAGLARFRAWEGDQKVNRWSHWIWRRYASSVWDDIRLDNVLPFRTPRTRTTRSTSTRCNST